MIPPANAPPLVLLPKRQAQVQEGGYICCSGGVPIFDGVDPRYKRILWTVIAINAAMFFIELAVGQLAGSHALQADALDLLPTPLPVA